MMLLPVLASLLVQSIRFPVAFETPVAGGEAMQVMVANKVNHASRLCDGQYPSQSSDGKLVAFAKTIWMADESVTLGLSSKLEVLSTSGSAATARVLATFNGAVTVSMPMFSPDGKEICFEVVPQRPNVSDPHRGVYVIPVSGGKPKLLYKPTFMPAAMTWPGWTSHGKEVLLTEGTNLVWVDEASKKVTQKPASFLIGTEWAKDSRLSMMRASPTNADSFAFTLTHLPGQPLADKHENVYLGKPGAAPKAISSGGTGWHPRWAADGKGIFFYEVGHGGGVADFRYCDVKSGQAQTVFTAQS